MLADVLATIPCKPPAIPLPVECLEYLRANAIPEDVIADLQASSYSDWITVSTLSVMPMPGLITQTTGIPDCIKNGYLTLAGGANGDPVAFHRDTRKMVFISHDTLWDKWDDFLECVQETPFHYEEFWEELVADEEFPWDYYEAQRRWR